MTVSLERFLQKQGFDVRSTRRQHLFVSRNGQPITTIAGTPSDSRSYRNAMAQLRRAGFKTEGKLTR